MAGPKPIPPTVTVEHWGGGGMTREVSHHPAFGNIMVSRPLGETQLAVLKSLKEHGGWPRGWTWDSESGTKRILDSLAQRCLVDKVPDPRGDRYHADYTISKLGEEVLQKQGA